MGGVTNGNLDQNLLSNMVGPGARKIKTKAFHEERMEYLLLSAISHQIQFSWNNQPEVEKITGKSQNDQRSTQCLDAQDCTNL